MKLLKKAKKAEKATTAMTATAVTSKKNKRSFFAVVAFVALVASSAPAWAHEAPPSLQGAQIRTEDLRSCGKLDLYCSPFTVNAFDQYGLSTPPQDLLGKQTQSGMALGKEDSSWEDPADRNSSRGPDSSGGPGILHVENPGQDEPRRDAPAPLPDLDKDDSITDRSVIRAFPVISGDEETAVGAAPPSSPIGQLKHLAGGLGCLSHVLDPEKMQHCLNHLWGLDIGTHGWVDLTAQTTASGDQAIR